MALATLLAALSGAAVPAAEAARPAPVRVDADEVHYAFQKREVTFTGKDAKPVVLTRDDATLTCKRLVAKTDDAGQIVTAACAGDVRLTRGARVVTCDHATFEAALDRVTCEGNPVLRDGGSEVKATRLVYELRSDEAKAEGARITLPGEEVERRRRELEERRSRRKP
ncbi:MAG TPA: LptA/OstA family protein [Anaeromyxobacter sp.]